MLAAKRSSKTNRPATDGPPTEGSELARYETLSKIAGEVVKALAIVVAGLWVLYRFGLSEYPSLAPAMTPSLSIEVKSYGSNNATCKVFLNVSFSNKSKQTVELTDVSLKLWTFTPSIDYSKVSFLDWDLVHQTDPAWVLPPNMNVFKKTYEPGQGQSYSYTLFIPKTVAEYLHARMEVKSPTKGIEEEVWTERTSILSC